MKCPECGLVLVNTTVVGTDESYRCGNCGGLWVKSWVINTIAGEPYNDIRITRYDIRKDKKEKGKNLRCPVDGGWLTLSNEERLPPDLPLWNCRKCKRWWLPGNSVFDLSEAFKVKAEFTKRWRRNEPAGHLLLPVLLTLVLAAGLAAVVTVIRNQQQVNINASSAVVGIPTVIYSGNGKAEVRFKTRGDLQSAMFIREKDKEWSQGYVMDEGVWKTMVIDGINPGEKVWVSLDQQVWRMTIGQKQ